ncbi:hypothetical protein D3C86_1614600 [compost metagenome]
MFVAWRLFKDDDIRRGDRVTAQAAKAFTVHRIFEANLKSTDDRLLVWVLQVCIEELHLIACINLW